MWLEASATTGTTHRKKKKKKKKKKNSPSDSRTVGAYGPKSWGGGEQYHPLSNSERVSSPSPPPHLPITFLLPSPPPFLGP